MIDLHSHTDESDGTLTPAELVGAAVSAGLTALAITDHDTLSGFDAAAPLAAQAGLDLVPGVELSTLLEFNGCARTVHLLAYFLGNSPPLRFRAWLEEIQQGRRERNRRLAERLQEIGVQVLLEEAESLGRSLTGRPHFARVIVAKGYAGNLRDAFDRYLGEHAPGFVQRDGPWLDEAIREIQASGGISVLAHPVRLDVDDIESEESLIGNLATYGLDGLEVFHSDHSPDDVARYSSYAARFRLIVTGGSDFHGEAKPGTALGSVQVPVQVLEQMRDRLVR